MKLSWTFLATTLFVINIFFLFYKNSSGINLEKQDFAPAILTGLLAASLTLYDIWKSQNKKANSLSQTVPSKQITANTKLQKDLSSAVQKTKAAPSLTQANTARFFYAKAIHNTWPKLFVLSQDGTLYCEYLDHMELVKMKKKSFDFNTFKSEDYKWGNYQPIVELTYEQAQATKLTKQSNWIDNYLKKL